MYNRIVVLLLALCSLPLTAQDTTPQLDVRRLGERAFSGAQAVVPCDSALIVVTTDNAYASSDGGVLWKEIAAPLTHKSVVDILCVNDTLYVLTNNGVLSRSTTQGLRWSQVERYKPRTVNRIRITTAGAEAWYLIDADKQTVNGTGYYHVRDSTLYIDHSYGVACAVTSPMFADASCMVTDGSTIFIGRKRKPILSINLGSGDIDEMDMAQMSTEFVNTLCLHQAWLYAGSVSPSGVVYRRRIEGGNWESININRNLEQADAQRIISTPQGVYIGFREQGVAFVPNSGSVAYPIHDAMGTVATISKGLLQNDVLLTTLSRGIVRIRNCGAEVETFASTLPHSGEYSVGALGNNVFVGVLEGYVLRSADDGKTWDTLSLQVPYASLRKIRCTSGRVVVCTSEGAWESLDLGSTWTRVFTSIPSQSIRDVHRLPQGWLVQANDDSYVISDSGSFTAFRPQGTFEYKPHIIDVAVNGKTIYAAGYPGLFVSRDSGVTWRVFGVADNQTLRSVNVWNNHIYLTGVRGQIFYVDVKDVQ